MSNLPIDETLIRSNTTTASFERGQDYFYQEAVISLIQREQILQALVQGSELRPYQVNIGLMEDRLPAVDCTCLYDYDGWCKHIVAALLTALRQPERIDERESLEELLNPLNEVQVKELVKYLSSKYPEMITSIERFLNRHSSPLSSPKVMISAKSYRNQVRSLVKQAITNAENEYWEEDIVPEELYSLVQEARDYCERGEGHNALAILEAITSTCIEEWEKLDEYGGDNTELCSELDKAWTEVILGSELSPQEREDLAQKLSQWQDEWGTTFEMSLEALRQGWDYPPLVQILQGNIPTEGLWTGLVPDYAENLTLIRLKLLENQEREPEYLNLARAEGQIISYLTKLVYLDRIPEAMQASTEIMTLIDEAYFFAKALRDEGALAEALAIATRGLSLAEGSVATRLYDLALWTCQLAESLNDGDTALAALIKAFQEKPSLEHYQKLQALTGEDWKDFKEDLLDYLRNFTDFMAQKGKIEIFLYEGLVEDAIATAPTYHSASRDLIYRIMDAAISVNPDWVIENARPPAEKILDAKKSEYYNEAIVWLKKVRAAFSESGRQAEWKAYREQLLKDHGRKPKFMALFKALD